MHHGIDSGKKKPPADVPPEQTTVPQHPCGIFLEAVDTRDSEELERLRRMGMNVNSKAVFVSSSLGQTAAMEEDKERSVEGDKLNGDEPKPYKRNLVISLKKR
ncbi:hypothetical protein B0H14DRAFT_2598310 [Mycena olivaceomarginata]|nr:hypothetical protein B0H14DRAFT_2598310 [Mycena olivaceomarginata]